MTNCGSCEGPLPLGVPGIHVIQEIIVNQERCEIIITKTTVFSRMCHRKTTSLQHHTIMHISPFLLNLTLNLVIVAIAVE